VRPVARGGFTLTGRGPTADLFARSATREKLANTMRREPLALPRPVRGDELVQRRESDL